MLKRNNCTKIVVSLIFCCGIIQSGILYAGLEGEWDFNESTSSQTYEDSSVNNYHLTRGSTLSTDVNDPAFSSDTPHHVNSSDYSADFDGTNDYAWITNYSELKPTSEFTLSTWVKIDSLDLGDPGNSDAQDILMSNIGAYNASGGYQLLIANANDPYIVLMYRPHTGSDYPDQGIGYSLSSLGWSTNTWYHVAGTYDESGGNALLNLYVDGKLVESDSFSGAISYDNTPKFYLGTNYDGVGNLATNERELDGHLDETQVFSDAKSATYVRNTLAEIDISWAAAVSDTASNKSRWFVQKIPGYSSNVILPNYGTPYTVTLDANWEIKDLDIEQNAKAYLGSHTLMVEDGGNIDGTLELAGATYNANQNLTMGSTGLISGYGTINRDISNNVGTIRAQGAGQQLSVSLESHDSEGTLSADTGATLYIRNAHDVTNRDTVSLAGGTLKGNPGIYNLVNDGASDVISGYGIIDDYKVSIGPGSLTATGSGKTLTLNEGFTSNQASGTINVQSGATLNVLQNWTNYATINMTGGSITGNLMNQNNGATGLFVSSGTNNIQNVTFASGSVNTLSNNSTLNITGTGTLNGASITESGTGGKFKVDTTATVQGYGTINPDVTNNGTLISNSSGNTLALNGSLNVGAGHSAYASSNGTLSVAGSVTNQGNLYAAATGTLNINGTLNNSGNTYSNGGSVNLNSSVFNTDDIYVNSGSVNIYGTIKSGALYGGGFSATNGSLTVYGSIENGSRNTFTAHSGGTITLPGNFSTSVFDINEGLIPQGGTLSLNPNMELSNTAGKSIKGYGTLLKYANNSLVNLGFIEANGGSLTVNGSVENSGSMKADGTADTLIVANSVINNVTGEIRAENGAEVYLNGAIKNEGVITSYDTDSSLYIADSDPMGEGSIIASNSGTIHVPDAFTNQFLTNKKALQLTGGTISATGGSMTNADGREISGYGTLSAGTNIMNKGVIRANHGHLQISGTTQNEGAIQAEGTDRVSISGVVTNQSLIKSSGGALITINQCINNGSIDVEHGSGSGTVTFGSSSGDGMYSLNNGKMLFSKELHMAAKSAIVDNNTASVIEINGNVTKEYGAADIFSAEHLDFNLFSKKEGFIHEVIWQAANMGASIDGLINNLAIGHLFFGDNIGASESDLFSFSADSIMYCYGLDILSDASINLGGSTIYYLRAGDVVNGVTGTGFNNAGNYYNGDIVEISVPIPEPCAALLFLGGLFILMRKQR
ncbi:MAG: LamG-like jellyroll fold domain-containing protein [Candidatus Auribacterota bacterium]